MEQLETHDPDDCDNDPEHEELLQHLAEYSWWNSLSESERDQQIRLTIKRG